MGGRGSTSPPGGDKRNSYQSSASYNKDLKTIWGYRNRGSNWLAAQREYGALLKKLPVGAVIDDHNEKYTKIGDDKFEYEITPAVPDLKIPAVTAVRDTKYVMNGGQIFYEWRVPTIKLPRKKKTKSK